MEYKEITFTYKNLLIDIVSNKEEFLNDKNIFYFVKNGGSIYFEIKTDNNDIITFRSISEKNGNVEKFSAITETEIALFDIKNREDVIYLNITQFKKGLTDYINEVEKTYDNLKDLKEELNNQTSKSILLEYINNDSI